MDNTKNINTVELFFGYGGNHLGIKRVLPGLRLVAACEIEAYAVANILSKMETGKLDSCPIWTDCKTFPTEPFEGGWVDLFIASYPCQPFSAAGKRKGTDDPRHLWPYVKGFIEKTRPKICFFENVEGHVSLGLREVLTDLVKLGYRVENDGGEATWGIFSAAEVGAPHQRKRVFIMAYIEGELAYTGYLSRRTKQWIEQKERAKEFHGGTKLANPGLLGQEKHEQQAAGAFEFGQKLAYTSQPGSQRRRELGEPSTGWQTTEELRHDAARCHSQRWPARPGEEQYPWEEPRTLGDSCERGSDWWPSRIRRRELESEKNVRTDGRDRGETDVLRQIKSIVGGEFDGGSKKLDPNRNRVDRLRLLGNGVVPATAEKAFVTLLNRILHPQFGEGIDIQMELF